MPKGAQDKKYTGEFKQQVVETMRDKKLGYNETAKLFGIRHKRVQDWERYTLSKARKVCMSIDVGEQPEILVKEDHRN